MMPLPDLASIITTTSSYSPKIDSPSIQLTIASLADAAVMLEWESISSVSQISADTTITVVATTPTRNPGCD